MVLVSHENLVTNPDLTSWEINGGQLYFQDGDQSKSMWERLWEILNSKTINILIILITLVECFVVLLELLIGLRIIQDPWIDECGWCNCNATAEISSDTNGGGGHQQQSSSQNLRIAKDVLSYISVGILTLFLLEIFLRVLSGRRKWFKQAAELCDGVVVILAFSLNLAFLFTSSKSANNSDGKIAVLFIVFLRFWRISRLLQGIVQDAKREMCHIINAYKRDKIQAEHKVEILILKVEDLEHEVAYLKEKLKKCDRDRSERKKVREGEMSSRAHHHHHHHAHHLDFDDDDSHSPWKSVPILSFTCAHRQTTPQPSSHPHHSPSHRPTMSLPVTPSPPSSIGGLQSPLNASPVNRTKSPRRRRSHDGAELLELSVTLDRASVNANAELDTIAEEAAGVKLKRHHGGGVEQHDSGRGSSYTPGSTPRVSGHHRKEHSDATEDRYTSTCAVPEPDQSDKVEPVSSPVSVVDDNVDDDEDDDQLKELSEIERVTKVIFHPTIERAKDVPVTVL